MKQILRNSLIVFMIVLLIFSFVPYLIPVSTYSFEEKKPFPQSQFMDVDGKKIHYREWKPEGQAPIGKAVFIHGFYGSTYSWNKNAEEVAKRGFYVVALDLPGFGYSTKEAGIDHSLTARANLVWDFLAKIDDGNTTLFDLPWNLVGHSMGGAVAAKIASERGNLGVLILIDPSINNQSFDFSKLVTWYPPVQRWTAVVARYYFFQYNRIQDFLTSAYGRRASDEEVKGYLEPMQEKGTSISAADIVRQGNDEKVDLQKIRITTLIIRGEKDTWISKGEMENLDRDIRFSKVVEIKDAGHVPQETHASEVNRELFYFFDLSSENTAGN